MSRVPVLLCLLVVCAAHDPWDAKGLPSPTDSNGLCGSNGRADRVCSPDGVLPLAALEALQTELVKIEREIPHACGNEAAPGFQVVAVAVERVVGGAPAVGAFTRSLHNRWGVGRRACGDGVVITLAVGDREAYISTGDAAGARLTARSIAAVIEAMRPLLRAQQYGPALLLAATKVRAALEALPSPPPPADGAGLYGVVMSVGTTVANLSGWCIALGCVYFLWNAGRWYSELVEAVGPLTASAAVAAYVAAAGVVVYLMLSSSLWPLAHVLSYTLAWVHLCWLMPAAASSGWAKTRARLLAIERAHAARLAGAGGAAASAATASLPTAFDAPTCSICLEDLAPPPSQLLPGDDHTDAPVAAAAAAALTLPCRHRFHAACLDLVFENRDNPRNTCPLCRAPAFPQPGGGGGRGFVDGRGVQPGVLDGLNFNGIDFGAGSGGGGSSGASAALAAPQGGGNVLNDESMAIMRLLHARYPQAVPWQAVQGVALPVPPRGLGATNAGFDFPRASAPPAPEVTTAAPPALGATTGRGLDPQPCTSESVASCAQAPATAAFAPLRAPAAVAAPGHFVAVGGGDGGRIVGDLVGGAVELVGRGLIELAGGLLGGICSGGGGGSW